MAKNILSDLADIYIDDAFANIDVINSNSWAALVNSELGESITDKELIKSITEKTVNNYHKEQQLNTGEIMALDIKKITDTKLLEYQTYISGQLRKYFKQCLEKRDDIDYKLHLPKVVWLADVSKHFSDKQNLKYSLHKNVNDIKSIPRSSYKFCEYGHECQFNYGNKAGCYAQHYVHNLIYSDIISLCQYLEFGYKSGEKINLEEIIKSINTISYVMNHMHEELYALSFYNENKTISIKKASKKKPKKKYIKIISEKIVS